MINTVLPVFGMLVTKCSKKAVKSALDGMTCATMPVITNKVDMDEKKRFRSLLFVGVQGPTHVTPMERIVAVTERAKAILNELHVDGKPTKFFVWTFVAMMADAVPPKSSLIIGRHSTDFGSMQIVERFSYVH
ncbi:hypothetical protein Tcan_16474 [Toxocara canis]|uniref:Uncharacterized protein n=1 Tax=Toxocara canis TaxID=6265 RepID=A0A0B2VXB5_TOXCA|nr:hypothetical protein Tcan_16474 [Toxocara canis]